MSFTLIRGLAGSGKSKRAIDLCVEAKNKGTPAILIVPEQYAHAAETALIDACGYITDDFQATSFKRFATRTLSACGIRRISPDSCKTAMLAERAASSVADKLTYYAVTQSRLRGYTALFTDAVAEFKKGAVTPQQLLDFAETSVSARTRAKLSDLALILNAYNTQFDASICDAEDDLTLCAQQIAERKLYKNTVIVVDAFSRFTQNEIAILTALMQSGCHLYVSLTLPATDSDTNLFDSTQRTANLLKTTAKTQNCSVCPDIILTVLPRYLTATARAVHDIFINPLQIDAANTTPPVIYRGQNRYDEVVGAATVIRTLVAQENTAYRDIGIIAGDYDAYAELISAVFPLYDIPIFADVRKDYTAHPIILYFYALTDLLTDFRTKNVFAYMKTGFCGISADEAARLENYTKACGIEYNDWLREERFLKRAQTVFSRAEDDVKAPEMLAIKNRMLSPVLDLKNALGKTKNVRDRVACFLSFFETVQLKKKVADFAQTLKAEGNLQEAEQFMQGYEILLSVFCSLEEILGDKNLGLSAIQSVLDAGLSQMSIGVIPSVYDSVSFGDMNRSVIKNKKVLIVLGANDGLMPQTVTPDILFSDDERTALNTAGIHVAPNSAQRIADNEFAVYNALCTMREKLYVFFSSADENGSSISPAPFVGRIQKTWENVTYREIPFDAESHAEYAVSPQSMFLYYLNQKTEYSDSAMHIRSFLESNKKTQPKLAQADAFQKNTEFHPHMNLSSETVSALYGNKLYGSVSRLERFAQCPFSYFLEYGLKVQEEKTPEIAAPDLGTLLHDVIEQFSKLVKARGMDFHTITQAQQQDLIREITDEQFSSMYLKSLFSEKRLAVLKKRLVSLVSKSVWAMCRHIAQGEFEPTGFEVSFAPDGDMPPVTVPLPDGGEITMTGRIDRIDTYRQNDVVYLKIIDYKSGAKSYRLSDIVSGKTLQLTMYVIAAEAGYLPDEKKGFGGMFYFHIDDPVTDGTPETDAYCDSVLKSFSMSGLCPTDPILLDALDHSGSGHSMIIPVFRTKDGGYSQSKSKVATEKNMFSLTQHVKKTVAAIGNEILNGNTHIAPLQEKDTLPCDFCKYNTVCGFDPYEHKKYIRQMPEKSEGELWEELEKDAMH